MYADLQLLLVLLLKYLVECTVVVPIAILCELQLIGRDNSPKKRPERQKSDTALSRMMSTCETREGLLS